MSAAFGQRLSTAGMTVDTTTLLTELMLTPDGRADPYPRYAAVREHTPAFRFPVGPMVVVTRYEDCQAILRDGRFGKGGAGLADSAAGREGKQRRRQSRPRVKASLLHMDPPEHTRLRRLVSLAFTPRTVERLRPGIVRLTDDLLDGFAGEVDVVAELADLLPVAVIGEMLGVPQEMREDLRPLVRDLVLSVEPGATADALERAWRASEAIGERFGSLIDERRRAPSEDLLSELVHVEEHGDRLDRGELVALIALLFGAGYETTTNLIGNGLLALLDHPDEMRRLRDDRSLLASAVDEMLRWDSPVQALARTALDDVQLYDVDVRTGETVALMIGCANRDPRAFHEPERFDIGRQGPAPVSFGAGIHYCIGAALARAEGQVAVDRMLDRFPTIEPAWGDERPRFRGIVVRGLEALPVLVGEHRP